ncbi:hypothetical protein [Archangium primigenium]|uniref:hypothetical protein n=1 Tax=[Archangium] primigenium TaxID=2792470 RepID=UPI001EF8B39A|nr:hypothetical protein [Archangium primigenium]
MMGRGIRASAVEVLSLNIQSLLGTYNVLNGEVQRILASHGIELESDSSRRWYPLEAIIRSLEDIRERIGTHTLRAFGSQVPRMAILPPQVDTFEQILPLLNDAYRRNHRGEGDIGGYHYQPLKKNSGRLRSDNPYPCEFDQGLLDGFHARLPPRSSAFQLRIVHAPEGCRSRGAEACTYVLTW